MDCSICLEAINKDTGCVTLSCEHKFHFRCIDMWFGKQIWERAEQTCPCCRSTGNHLDRCEIEQTYVEEEESVHEDNYINELVARDDLILEYNVLTGQLLFTPSLEVCLTHVRNIFGPLNEVEWEDDPSPEAARKIQAIFRGYRTRQTYHDALSLLQLRA